MIPDFQSFMLPLLQTIDKNDENSIKLLKEAIIKYFVISEEEQAKKIPSGKQSIFYNRLSWGVSYLKMAGLIDCPQRAVYRITELGKKVLANPPGKITISYLKQFEDFDQNKNSDKLKKSTINDGEQENIEKTPDELFEFGYTQIMHNLKDQLKQKISECSPYYFEQIVLDLLVKMGYGGSEIDNSTLTKKSSDEGIDGIIKEDKLGLDKIYIQVKKWEKQVGRPEIQKFVGALQGKRAKKGVFITTSEFSKESYEYAKHLGHR